MSPSLINRWCVFEPEARREIDEILREHGTNTDAIMAQTLVRYLPAFEALERMVSSARGQRDRIAANLKKARLDAAGGTIRSSAEVTDVEILSGHAVGVAKSAVKPGRKTGPRTPQATRSSQNHSGTGSRVTSLQAHPLFLAIVDTIRRETGVSSPVAEEVAFAELKLRRMTSAEMHVHSGLNGASDAEAVGALTALMALNRYETEPARRCGGLLRRFALTRLDAAPWPRRERSFAL